MRNEPIPIEIREGFYIWIQGIPYDFSASEAEKVAKIIHALAIKEAEERK